MKKFYYLFFLLLLGGRIYATTYSGASGNITWSFNTETGILTLAGNGAMNNYSELLIDGVWHISAPWDTYRSKIQKVVVNQGVTSIGDYAFKGCSNLTSIAIPESVTSIGDCVFSDCSSLASITIPEGVTSIGTGSFYGCNSLVDATINCSTVGSWFGGATHMETVTLGEKVTVIGDKAFNYCRLTSITISEGVTSIGSYAFYDCSNLTSITIPRSVTSIGTYAFSGCSSLASITISEGVTSIGAWAFKGCSSLISITIPESVTSIGDCVFYDCNGLANVTINCQTIGSWFREKTSIRTITLGENVTSIGGSAFYGCSSLTSITIPEGVTSIGGSAFSYCSSLTSITIPEGVTSIGNNAFRDCSSLASITIPEGVTSIGNYAFYGCSSLTSITIPESVTNIEYSAFAECSNLTSVTMESRTPCTLSGIKTSLTQFPVSNENFKIYVPDGSKWIYQNNIGGWPSYANYIVESKPALITGADGNIDWSLDPTNGVLTLNGTGTMKLYDAEFGTKTGPQGNEYYGGTTTAPWGEYYSLIKEVVVNTGISNIGKSAFFGCNNVTSITLPESVTRIEIDAFSYCSSLTSITLPKSVSSIRMGAFSYCNRLTAIALPQNLTSIESCTFEGCNRLTSILLPKGVTSIGNFAFRDCTGLTFITVPEGVTSIGKEAFSSCNSLSSIILPESLTNVGENAFSGCNGLEEVTINSANVGNWFSGNTSIETVTLGEKVTSIGKSAFDGCSSLASITIPENVTIIGTGAFSGCSSLTSITLPNSVTSIGDCAFQACVNLASITLPESLTSIGMQTFYWCSSLISLTIPESVTSIGSSAFYCCSNLTSITFPESVTSIGNQAFYDCNSLTSITMNAPSPCTLSTYSVFPSSNEGFMIYVPYGSGESYKSAEGWSDYADYIVEPIPDPITRVDGNITWSLDTISGVLTLSGNGTINDYDLYTPWYEYYSYIKEVVIQNGVTSIGNNAFDGCSSLTSITIPEGVTSIGTRAFYSCSSLTSITIPEGVTSIGGAAFVNCTSLTSITIPEGVTSIGSYAFDGCSSLTSITIPEGVTSIGTGAFFSCSGLTSVTIPESVTSIGAGAFSRCSSLTSITIPESVTSIEGAAFRDCSSLTSITIPEGVTSIGSYAFQGCSGLTSVTIPESVTSIGDKAFYSCSSLTTITIPESVASIGKYAFYYCSSLASITIPEGVTSIGNNAFYDCSNLTSVTMKASTPCAFYTNTYTAVGDGVYDVFPSSNEGFKIYVPYGSGETYKNADGWSDYADYIVEMEEEPADDDSATPTPELLPTTDLSEYDYALYFLDTEVNTDVEVTIPLNLKNAEENITAFQCDIYLLEGVKWASSIDKRGNEILTQPTFNADADRTDANYHTITPVTKMSNGAYRVMCYSMNKEIFLDNDGAVLDIPVVIPEDMEDGEYNLIIKDIFITDTDTEQHEVEEVVSKLTVVGYTLGDPNADGLINITDIVSVISYILEEAPANFNFKAADVNGDGIINITDIVAIIDIILTDEAPASARRIRRPTFGSAPAGLTSLEIVPFGIDAGTTSATVTLDLLNPNDEFTAFECDIVLPEGIDWEYTIDRRGNIIYTQPTFNADADRTDANYHTLANIKKMEDGSFKVMCYSMAKEIFLDSEGAILNLPLTFSPELAEGIYEIEVNNTVLTRTDVSDEKIPSYRASVVVGTPAVKSAAIYGDVNATAVAMINERLAGCGTLDLRGALAVDGNTAFTLNDNAVIYVADGMSIKNEKNVVEDGTCAVLTLTDGVAFTPTESFTAESASYDRTLGKDEYGTLVLPFEPDAATKAAYAFYELSEADGSTLTFDETTTPEAGVPYVIVRKDNTTALTGSGTIAITAGDATADGWTMKGTYETLVFTDATELASLYCLSGNQFKQATSKLTMNPFRAYFQGSGTMGCITLRGSDGTTRILSETLEPAGDCYDLTGRRVLNAEKGIYIVNGKKVLK